MAGLSAGSGLPAADAAPSAAQPHVPGVLWAPQPAPALWAWGQAHTLYTLAITPTRACRALGRARQ